MQNIVQKLQTFTENATRVGDRDFLLLLEEIFDIFRSENRGFTERQLETVGTIMLRLAYRQDVEIRADLAKRIAPEENAPHNLIITMAQDEIDVAESVLAISPVLTLHDLLELAEQQDQEHLQAIAGRFEVDPRISQVLIDRGNVDTVEKLMRNVGAGISDDCARKIVELAVNHTNLQQALVDREDISSDNLTSAYFFVEGDLKQQIVGAWADLPVRSLSADQDSVEFRSASAKLDVVEERIEGMKRKGTLQETNIVQFVRAQSPLEFLIGLAKIADLDVSHVRRAVDDPTGKSLLILCKSCGFSVPAFKSIILSSLSSVSGKPTITLSLLNKYRAFDRSDASRVVSFWRSNEALDELAVSV